MKTKNGNEELNAAAVNYYAAGKGEEIVKAAWAAVRALPESAGMLERFEAADKAAQCTPSGKMAAHKDSEKQKQINAMRDEITLLESFNKISVIEIQAIAEQMKVRRERMNKLRLAIGHAIWTK